MVHASRVINTNGRNPSVRCRFYRIIFRIDCHMEKSILLFIRIFIFGYIDISYFLLTNLNRYDVFSIVRRSEKNNFSRRFFNLLLIPHFK